MTRSEPPREQWLARVRDELTTLTRRGTARARQSHPALSLVDQSLLTYIESNPECRAIDIAAHFQLNRSTVSRQLQSLVSAGLIEMGPEQTSRGHRSHGRGQPITLTDSGHRVQAEAAAGVLASLTARLTGWSDDEVRMLAGTLHRFNDESTPMPDASMPAPDASMPGPDASASTTRAESPTLESAPTEGQPS
ncbi:MarR family winged helix-turn-helix transcriptional regulator [Subtercola lobariae]|uniref:HTH marR-type domain-containing protein n=1 Tax=Subtercola lobariae TaxID=1588641 RepID=A0A917B1R4_9MICO|nr:MarR family winged helix-turn-helix transcriptional regulator [Subtercola lobariae]GGF17621.1 hypothetical protein GCM10011399_09210 [Subtercola lobariae]